MRQKHPAVKRRSLRWSLAKVLCWTLRATSSVQIETSFPKCKVYLSSFFRAGVEQFKLMNRYGSKDERSARVLITQEKTLKNKKSVRSIQDATIFENIRWWENHCRQDPLQWTSRHTTFFNHCERLIVCFSLKPAVTVLYDQCTSRNTLNEKFRMI